MGKSVCACGRLKDARSARCHVCALARAKRMLPYRLPKAERRARGLE